MDNYSNVRRIVVAEDHVFQRRVLHHQISSLGYQFIFEAETGAEALRLCQQNNIDVLFCDLRMPGMDGMALLRQLSIMGFRGSIIISSALEQDVIDSVLLMGETYGLRMLGTVRKPASAKQIEKLLASRCPGSSPAKISHTPTVTSDELRWALDKGEIKPWYQPKVSFSTGEWLGTEALARWHHSEHGFVSPAKFISLAEQNGLIDQLTDSIFCQSMQAVHRWGLRGLSINLSTKSLLNVRLFNALLGYCEQWGVSPKMITLEVTEGVFIEDVGRSLEVLSRMRMHGFGLSIDDFGTGYSSVQQLTILPFTELKLDRSFITRCSQNKSSRAVVEYSLKLAHQLGLKTVAEGVEDEQTWQTLAALGCDMCQGFFSARPMPENELGHWHEEWKRKAESINVNVNVNK
jgi:EAL domain-containing protein (putative c-di-GMP-specific phosphodiesterase class I)/ActR/RegA family two-component response regulator